MAEDTGQHNQSWGNIFWNTIIPENTEIILKAKTGITDEITDVDLCDNLATITADNQYGSAPMANNSCVTADHRYIRYYLNFISSDTVATPKLEDISFSFNYYSSQTLTSSPYNSTNINNAIEKIEWSENLENDTDIKFQIRTAPTSEDLSSADWLGPTGTDDYYTDPSGADIIPSHRNTVNNQWFQYKVFLISNGLNTPTLSDVTITYTGNEETINQENQKNKKQENDEIQEQENSKARKQENNEVRKQDVAIANNPSLVVWDGDGQDNNWSTCDNWSNNTCPISGDSVIFNISNVKDSIIDYAITVNDFSIDGYGGTIILEQNLTIAGNFTLKSGTISAGANNITVGGDWINNGGIFLADSSTVAINNADKISTITGDNTFYNFQCLTPAKRIEFEAGSSQTVLGQFKILGAYAQHVRLVSKTKGEQWKIDPQGQRDINYGWVEDSENLNGEKIIMTESTNRGGCTNWDPTGTWTNGLGTGIWSAGGNWAGFGGVEPGAGDTVVFDSTSTANSSVDAVFAGTVAGVNINSGYAGTISLARSLTISGGYTQATGTLTSGVNNITVTGNVVISGGTLTAPSTTLTVGGNWTHTAGTFTHNSGTVNFNGSGTQTISYEVDPFYNVTYSGSGTLRLSPSWLYKQKITISSSMVANTNQTDFPVLIKIQDENNPLFTTAQTDGDDIVFTLSDGTKLSHEIELFNATAGSRSLWAWVKIPTLSASSDTVVYMHYGNASCASQQNATAVWSSSYAGVWHLGDAGPTTANDSTSNYNAGTQSGGVTFGATGQVDGATTYAGDNDFINLGTINLLSGGTGTVSVWVKLGAGSVSKNNYLITKGSDNSSGSWGLDIIPADVANSNLVLLYGTGAWVTTGNISYSFTDYHLFTAVMKSNNTQELYLDGVLKTTGSRTVITPNATRGFAIGKQFRTSYEYYTTGSLDEANVSTAQRSADWILTEYRNRSSPATYETTAAQEAGAIKITGAFTTSGTNIVDNATNNPSLDIAGALTLASGTTYTKGAGSVYLTGATADINFNSKTIEDLIINASAAKTLTGVLTTDSLTVQAGTLTSGANDVTVSGNVVISGSILSAPSTTLTVGGNWSNTGTFTDNSGTVSFNGAADQTITTNAQPFYNLTLNNTGTSGSDDIIISGALDVNGLLTITDGDLDISTNDPNVNIAGGMTVGSSGSIDLSAYLGTWTYDGNGTLTDNRATKGDLKTFTIDGSSAVLTLGSSVKSTSITTGADDTLNLGAGSYTLELTGTGTPLTATGTFDKGAGSTVNYTGSGTATNVTTVAYNNLTFTPTSATTYSLTGDLISNNAMSGNLTINANAILDATASNYGITLAGNWTNSGAFTARNGIATFNGVVAQTITGATTWYNLIINNSYATPNDTYDVDPAAVQTVAGTLTITDGQWTPYTGDDYNNVSIGANGIMKPDASASITASGDWENAGTFTHNNGTVTLDGVTQSISGSNAFYNLTKSVASADTLTFDNTSTQTIANAMILQGASGQLLSLRSNSNGVQWEIDPQGTRTISYLDVKDSNNTNATAIAVFGFNITNSGNNTNWTFNTAPSLTFDNDFSTWQSGNVIINYNLIDNDSNTCNISQGATSGIEYSTDNSNWHDATDAGGSSDRLINLASSPTTGTDHDFVWNSSADLATTEDSAVWIRIRPNDGTVDADAWASSNSFGLDNVAPSSVGAPTYGTITSSSIIINKPTSVTENGSGLYQWQARRNSSSDLGLNSTSTESILDSILSENTQYTYDVQFKDNQNNKSAYGTQASKYTLADTPTNFTATPNLTSITLSIGTFPNDTAGSSGYYFENITKGTNSGWIGVNRWEDAVLLCGTQYMYTVKYRNGDGVETSEAAITQSTNICGGGLPPSAYNPPTPPVSTLESPAGFNILINNGDKYTNNKIVFLKLSGGPSARKMAISNSADFKDASQIPFQAEINWELEVNPASSAGQNFIKSKVGNEFTVYIKFLGHTEYCHSG